MMRKLAIFSVFLVGLLGSYNSAIAEGFVIQLPQNESKVSQDQDDGYVVETVTGSKIVVFCSRYNTRAMQNVAKKWNAQSYNLPNGAEFPVSVNSKFYCKHGNFMTNDTFGLHQIDGRDVANPSVVGYTIVPSSLKMFAYTNDNVPNTNNDNVDLKFYYYNGCPESRNGARDNFYLTSTMRCSYNCPVGAKQFEAFATQVSDNKEKNMALAYILCDDKGSTEQKSQKEKDDKNKIILAKKAACESQKAEGAYWNISKEKCECKDNKIWNGGTCIVPAAVCPKDVLNWLQDVITGDSYNNYSKDIKDKIDDLMRICSNKKQSAQEKFDSDVNDLKRLLDKYEETNNRKITDTEKNIKSVADRINGVTKDFNKSVWKTNEGEFNKTRLLSDSVAGVVLGTAGGLITSSVIKKNQTDNGFDDISCTVGGQVVSGWGDEFTVGIR